MREIARDTRPPTLVVHSANNLAIRHIGSMGGDGRLALRRPRRRQSGRGLDRVLSRFVRTDHRSAPSSATTRISCPYAARLESLSGEDLYVAVGSVHADALAVTDLVRRRSTPTTAAKPYSRAITAPWVMRPLTSVTRPVIETNRRDQLGSVCVVTMMSPGSRSAWAMSRMTRARPSMVPADTGRPHSAPVGGLSRSYAPAMASPSEVSTRGGVSA